MWETRDWCDVSVRTTGALVPRGRALMSGRSRGAGSPPYPRSLTHGGGHPPEEEFITRLAPGGVPPAATGRTRVGQKFASGHAVSVGEACASRIPCFTDGRCTARRPAPRFQQRPSLRVSAPRSPSACRMANVSILAASVPLTSAQRAGLADTEARWRFLATR